MEMLRKLEDSIAAIFKGLPHMPSSVRAWLARNIWWITLIVAIFIILGSWAFAAMFFFAGIILAVFGGGAGAAVGGAMWTVMIAILIFSAIELILMCWAISPLKRLSKKGWNLLFVLSLVNVASLVMGYLFKYDVFELVWGLLFSGFGAYLLFEIRHYFIESLTIEKSVDSVATVVK